MTAKTNGPWREPVFADALAEFTAYFVQNYPGPETVIYDPKWHAPRIFRAAKYAIERAAPAAAPPEPAPDVDALNVICDGDPVALVCVPRGIVRSLRTTIEQQARELAETRHVLMHNAARAAIKEPK